MSFPRYPKYKDSGVEWLGQVPEHWRSGSIRWLARRYAGGTPDKSNLSFWENGTVPWINSGAVNDRLISEPSAYITQEALDKSSARWTPAGALVMALAGQGKTKGMVAQLGIRATCNQSMAAIIPGDELNARFLFWWLESNYENIRNLAGGDLRDGLNLELVGNIKCPLPSNPEQIRIAEFLDQETAKIDALVAEQERLIALLREKRQAVISHAVTKGLNSKAPMKPSGIEWLGDVPTHWEVKALGRITLARCDGPFGSGLKSEHYSESGVRIIRLQNIRANGFSDSDAAFIDKEYHDKEVKGHEVVAGDVLIAGLGDDNNLVGRACVAPFGIEPAMVKADCFRFRLDRERALPTFVARVLSVSATFDAGMLATGTTRSRIPLSITSRRRIPLPPLDEQTAIVAQLERELAKFDNLTSEAQHAIDLLQERRTALISAAVTGQIDVRKANLIYEPGI
jgi:type I restriction enzyme S subunit